MDLLFGSTDNSQPVVIMGTLGKRLRVLTYRVGEGEVVGDSLLLRPYPGQSVEEGVSRAAWILRLDLRTRDLGDGSYMVERAT